MLKKFRGWAQKPTIDTVKIKTANILRGENYITGIGPQGELFNVEVALSSEWALNGVPHRTSRLIVLKTSTAAHSIV